MRCLRVLAVVAVFVCACTKPNPRSCGDGTCTDPEFPFCDVDGTLGGLAGECIAVACEPGVFEACRNDQAVICAATGDNFDLEKCQFGCDSSLGCKACITDDQCSAEAPVCDHSICRGCVLDDECASRICDAGVCATDSILYASGTGSNSDLCTLDDPCSVDKALASAKGASPQPRVRMLPGVYTQSVLISGVAASDLIVVATGAQLVSTLNVTQGGNASIRGLDITSITNFALQCGEQAGPRSKLSLSNAKIRAGNGSVNLITTGNCTLTIVDADVDLGQSTGTAISLAQNTSASFDRIHLHGESSPSLGTFGTGIQLSVTNSILDDPAIGFLTSDGGSSMRFGFNTIVLRTPGTSLSCDPTATNILYENNIIAARGTNQPSVITGTDCELTNNLIDPQATLPAGNFTGDPEFASVANHDYHVSSTSPAVDAAAFGLAINSDHAFDGISRPQGMGPDIGAFER